MNKAIIGLCLLLSIGTAVADTVSKTFLVKYVSTDHVYIDGGRNEGLHTNDTLQVFRNDSQIALLQITFIADNSASCVILERQQTPISGDKVVADIRIEEPAAQTPAAPKIESAQSNEPAPEVTQPFATIHGRAALQIYHYDDRSPANLDFTQPTLRLDLTASELGGGNIGFKLRMKSRHNSRTRSYSSNVNKNEWRNNIYEMSFRWGDDNSKIRAEFGRIIPRSVAGVGYIDGLLIEHAVNSSFKTGLFVGSQPEWQYAKLRTSLQKYGIFANYTTGDYKQLRWESSLALAGEYHSATVSREFIYLRNALSVNRKLRLYQAVEIEINRGWRKQRAGNSLDLSSLYLSARYQFSGRLNAALSYDNRRNYLTYDTRTLDEQLFDDYLRQGIKGNIYFRPINNFNLNIGAGYRKRENESDATYSYSAGIRLANLLRRMYFITTNINGFNGVLADGLYLAAGLGKNFTRGDQVTINYGIYRYKYAANNDTRKSSWLGFDTNIRLYRRYYFYGDYRQNFGDDLKGGQILAEIGYRF